MRHVARGVTLFALLPEGGLLLSCLEGTSDRSVGALPMEGTWDQRLGYRSRRDMGPENGYPPPKKKEKKDRTSDKALGYFSW